MSMITLKYSQTGDKRLPFAKAVSEILGVKPKYTGVPRCAYIIGFTTVNREGNIEVDDQTDNVKLSSLMQKLAARGYTVEQDSASLPQAVDERMTAVQMDNAPAAETIPDSSQHDEEQPLTSIPETRQIEVAPSTSHQSENEPSINDQSQAEQPVEDESVGTTISVPRDIFTDLGLENLRKILWAKGELICNALNIENTEIEVTDEAVSFPWFGELNAEEVKYISQFISGLCEFANTSKRITSKQRRDDNPKFAMRTWAIRLGFNGAEYKGLRSYLMKRLPGDAAWRFGKPDNSVPTEPRLPINVRVTA